MKVELMSKNIVAIMKQLSKNPAIVMLLSNNQKNPLDSSHPIVSGEEIVKIGSKSAKIFPYPFEPEAQVQDSSFIRVYYNSGDFNSGETISESQIHIDIIVAKSLWLINDINNNSVIRPYEILDRVVNLLGSRSTNNTIKLKFDGWQHLSVNNKFDAIRLYAEYMSVTT